MPFVDLIIMTKIQPKFTEENVYVRTLERNNARLGHEKVWSPTGSYGFIKLRCVVRGSVRDIMSQSPEAEKLLQYC